MSDELKISPPENEPSALESDRSSGEMANFTPTQRSVVQYENHIAYLEGEVARYRCKCDELGVKLEREFRFRAVHADMKRGKVEALIHLGGTLFCTGMGALFLAVYPRTESGAPPQFWVGVALAAAGVILGIGEQVLTLTLCYVWPKFSDPDRAKISSDS